MFYSLKCTNKLKQMLLMWASFKLRANKMKTKVDFFLPSLKPTGICNNPFQSFSNQFSYSILMKYRQNSGWDDQYISWSHTLLYITPLFTISQIVQQQWMWKIIFGILLALLGCTSILTYFLWKALFQENSKLWLLSKNWWKDYGDKLP